MPAAFTRKAASVNSQNVETMPQNKYLVKQQFVLDLFEQISDTSHSIQAVFLSTTDGHSIAKKVRKELPESKVAAMTSSCMALGDQLSATVEHKRCEYVIIQNEQGYLALKKVGNKLVLTVVAKADVNLGLLLTATKNAALKLEDELKRSAA